MPQLIPFNFTNQTISVFIVLTVIIYLFTKYVLARIPRLFTTREILQSN